MHTLYSESIDNSSILSGISQTTVSQKRLVSYPGAIIGLEHYLLETSPQNGLNHIAACEPCIIGHLDMSMLVALTTVDKRFHRVIARNFMKGLLNGVRDMIPMLA